MLWKDELGIIQQTVRATQPLSAAILLKAMFPLISSVCLPMHLMRFDRSWNANGIRNGRGRRF
jgi:hypothetical protein